MAAADGVLGLGFQRRGSEGGAARGRPLDHEGRGGPASEGSREQHGGIGDMATVASLSPQGR